VDLRLPRADRAAAAPGGDHAAGAPPRGHALRRALRAAHRGDAAEHARAPHAGDLTAPVAPADPARLATGSATPLTPTCRELADNVALSVRVIRRPHERSALDVREAHRARLGFERRELVGVHVARDRQVLPRRAQVLPERQDVDADRAQLAHHLADLVQLLA